MGTKVFGALCLAVGLAGLGGITNIALMLRSRPPTQGATFDASWNSGGVLMQVKGVGCDTACLESMLQTLPPTR